MKFLATTMTGVIEEMIQAGCCGATVPDVDYEEKTLEQCLEQACLNLLGSTAKDCFYSASLDGDYLTLTAD